MFRRFTGLATLAALQLVVLVLAHELVFLARWGSRYNEALVHSGHGAAWDSAATTVLALGALLVVAAMARLIQLAGMVPRTNGPGAARRGDRRGLARLSLGFGVPLAVVGSVLLSVQENVERAALGSHASDPLILLSPEYAGGLWIALAVGLLVGAVAALFVWRRDALLARLRRHRPARPRPPIAARTGLEVRSPHESIIGRRSALRAPPATLAP